MCRKFTNAIFKVTVTSAARYPELNSYQLSAKKNNQRAQKLVKYCDVRASKFCVISLPKRKQNILRTIYTW